MSDFYSSNEVALLLYHVDILNEAEILQWSLPEMRKEVGEKTGEQISRLRWGEEKHRPPSWPEQVKSWSSTKNPAHSQEDKDLAMPMVEVFKIYAKNRIASKNLKHEDHIDPNHDREKAAKKWKNRGKKAPVVEEELWGEAGEQLQDLYPEDQLLPVEQLPEDELYREVQPGQPGETDQLREEGLQPGPSLPQSDGSPVSPVALAGSSQLQDLDSESEDEEERDERGRIILPPRPASPELRPTPEVVRASSTPSLRPSTAEGSHSSPTPSPARPSTSASPSSSAGRRSTQLFDHAGSRRGRGKGGLRMMIRRNQIVNNNSLCEPNIDTPDKNKARTEWKKWMARYLKKIEKEISENQNNQEIQCNQCQKFVLKQGQNY